MYANELQVNINTTDIGVITPYRQQVKLLHEGLRCAGHSDVEVNTVDQYQGRDKAVIVISFVKLGNSSSLPAVSVSQCELNVVNYSYPVFSAHLTVRAC